MNAWTCDWCGAPLQPLDGGWVDVLYGSGDYCPEGHAVSRETGTSPHLPVVADPTPVAGSTIPPLDVLRPFAEDIDKAINEAGIAGQFIAGPLLYLRWVPQHAVESALALIPGLPCPMRSSITDEPCALTWGHPMDSAVRFHRFAARLTSPTPDETPVRGEEKRL